MQLDSFLSKCFCYEVQHFMAMKWNTINYRFYFTDWWNQGKSNFFMWWPFRYGKAFDLLDCKRCWKAARDICLMAFFLYWFGISVSVINWLYLLCFLFVFYVSVKIWWHFQKKQEEEKSVLIPLIFLIVKIIPVSLYECFFFFL